MRRARVWAMCVGAPRARSRARSCARRAVQGRLRTMSAPASAHHGWWASGGALHASLEVLDLDEQLEAIRIPPNISHVVIEGACIQSCVLRKTMCNHVPSNPSLFPCTACAYPAHTLYQNDTIGIIPDVVGANSRNWLWDEAVPVSVDGIWPGVPIRAQPHVLLLAFEPLLEQYAKYLSMMTHADARECCQRRTRGLLALSAHSARGLTALVLVKQTQFGHGHRGGLCVGAPSFYLLLLRLMWIRRDAVVGYMSQTWMAARPCSTSIAT